MRNVTLDFSWPGKPIDNYVECFDASVRLECLEQHWFMDLDDTISKIEDWRCECNEVRLHSAIGDRTPMSLFQKPWQFAEASQPRRFSARFRFGDAAILHLADVQRTGSRSVPLLPVPYVIGQAGGTPAKAV